MDTILVQESKRLSLVKATTSNKRLSIPELSSFIIDLDFLLSYLGTTKNPILVLAFPRHVDHYVLLLEMFPTLEIHVWEPESVFAEDGGSRIKIFRTYRNAQSFENEYSKKEYIHRTFLISHLKRFAEDPQTQETLNLEDMVTQEKLCRAGLFVKCCIRFRVPIEGESFRYFRGIQKFIPYADDNNFDTILYSNKDGSWEVCDYDTKWYLESLVYYNSVTRERSGTVSFDNQMLINVLDRYMKAHDSRGKTSILLDYCLEKINLSSARKITTRGYSQSEGIFTECILSRVQLEDINIAKAWLQESKTFNEMEGF